MKLSKKLKQIKGDASNRLFFRNKKEKSSSIIVFSKKDKRLNLLVYDSINKIFIKNNILAPKLISENYSKNFIEIQDLGNYTIFNFLKKNYKKKIFIFKKIIDILNKIQLIKDKKIKNFKNKNYIIPRYTSKLLLEEAKLFSNWYVPKMLPYKNQLKFKKDYEKIIKALIKKIAQKNNCLVHRDFHVSNLMFKNNKIGVIDSQDALIGNMAYDVASLIDDVRFKTSNNFKEKILSIYLRSQKNLNIKKFKNDFLIISVLRNLKIIGIFTRLAIRDNKKNYLKLIPYTWSLIRNRSKKSDMFNELNNLLIKNFNKKFFIK